MNLAGASIWYLQQADRAVKRPDLAPETREILQKRIDDIKADMDKQLSLIHICLQAMAMAIIMRWHMPPLNSWG